ncbi:MHYT domain-containing protein [Marinobacter koreensis]|uniref:MHYT domain-containing protein n=1 Tax=Marinobacter koreensis TaxID=335974 RepID=UPI00361CDDDD
MAGCGSRVLSGLADYQSSFGQSVAVCHGHTGDGRGIVVMHYLGMYAMRMSVPPEFNALWLGVSVAIAVIASGGALALCRILARMEGAPSPLIRLGAALTMAVAICGMHYTGMLAMTFPGMPCRLRITAFGATGWASRWQSSALPFWPWRCLLRSTTCRNVASES